MREHYDHTLERLSSLAVRLKEEGDVLTQIDGGGGSNRMANLYYERRSAILDAIVIVEQCFEEKEWEITPSEELACVEI